MPEQRSYCGRRRPAIHHLAKPRVSTNPRTQFPPLLDCVATGVSELIVFSSWTRYSLYPEEEPRSTVVAYPSVQADSGHAELSVWAWLSMPESAQQLSRTAVSLFPGDEAY
ncbi:hypothetical protein EYF80_006518 [Liparis tanakae]|uniref:Uncharacterized protein n=1 Tax=Liparis tanakae TaxID=230148 RepID=A0A4Z2IYW2_9TELE|nr:hypothetical protein EYF80_006518 [Liparis tanakae]